MAKNTAETVDDGYQYEDGDVSDAAVASGEYVVRARSGHAFQSSDESIPLITAKGVPLTAEQAEFVLAEDNHTGILFMEPVETDKEGS